jgi:Arylsulfotransferase (ASST)
VKPTFLRRLAPLLVAAGIALPAAGCGLDEQASPADSASIEISGLLPSFDAEQRRYVSRCGRGAAPIEVDAGDGVEVSVDSGQPRGGSFELEGAAPPGADFRLAVSDGDERHGYRVRCLPAGFPEWRFESGQELAPGFFTVSLPTSSDSRSWVIVFDHEGVPRWWYSPRKRVLWAQVLSDGTVSWARSFGDGYGLDPRMAHEVRSLAGEPLRVVKTEGTIIDGHEFREVGDGNVLVDSYTPETADLRRFCARPPRERCGPERAAIVSAEIQELDRAGRVLWRWNSRGRVALAETGRWWRSVLSNPRRRLQGREAFDPIHINSIEPRGPDEVVTSTRHTDAIYGIRRDGEIAWKLGGTETANSLRILGDPAEKLFGGQHDARIAADGSLSVYDNGKSRPRRPRVAFYRLEPDRGTATYLGQLNDPAVRTSHCCGSARQLADGGWLVSWGDNSLVTAFTSSDDVAFRLDLDAPTYRAVPVPPGAVSAAQLDRGLEAMAP